MNVNNILKRTQNNQSLVFLSFPDLLSAQKDTDAEITLSQLPNRVMTFENLRYLIFPHMLYAEPRGAILTASCPLKYTIYRNLKLKTGLLLRT